MIRPAASPGRVLAVASVAMFLVSLDATIGFALFPALQLRYRDASPGTLAWVLTAYTIVYAALLVPAGRLADLKGRRRLFLWGLLVFAGSSALCGCAPSVESLIACRVAQAVGAALLTPTALALVLQAFPPGRRAHAVGMMGAVGALAASIGPSAGAWVVELGGWQWAFWINVPIAMLAWPIAARALSESTNLATGASADALGIGLLMTAVGLLTFGVLQSASWGWSAPGTLAVLFLGTVLLLQLWRRSAGRPNAALDVDLFRDRGYRYANAATLAFGIAFTAMFLVCFLFLTRIWGYSLVQAGLAITPGPLLVIPVAVLAGRVASRLGFRPLLLAGGVIYAASGLWFHLVLTPNANFMLGWLPGMLLSGLGVGLVLPILSGASASSLPAPKFGVGTALNVAVRQFGSALGVAITVALVGTPGLGIDRFLDAFLLLVAGGLATAGLSMGVATPTTQTPSLRPSPTKG